MIWECAKLTCLLNLPSQSIYPGQGFKYTFIQVDLGGPLAIFLFFRVMETAEQKDITIIQEGKNDTAGDKVKLLPWRFNYF